MPEPDQIVSAPADESRGPGLPGLVASLIGWTVGLFGGAVSGAIALSASGLDADAFDELSLGWLAVAQLGLWLGLLGAPWFFARWTGSTLRDAFGLRGERSDVLVGGLAGLLGQFAIVWLVYIPMSWFTDISQQEFSEPARDMTERASGPVGVVLLVLIVGIGAPIVEEIFYRGLLQRSLVSLVGVPAGIGIASLLFGAAHLQLLQLPALTLAGLLFGVLAHRTGRLGPAIAAHVVFNMTAVLVLLAEN